MCHNVSYKLFLTQNSLKLDQGTKTKPTIQTMNNDEETKETVKVEYFSKRRNSSGVESRISLFGEILFAQSYEGSLETTNIHWGQLFPNIHFFHHSMKQLMACMSQLRNYKHIFMVTICK